MIHKINNKVELEYQGYEFYFDVEYNYDYGLHGESISNPSTKLYGYDRDNSDVCKDGEPLKPHKRNFFLAVAWNRNRSEILEIIGARVEMYLEENEDEELEGLRDQFLD